MCEFFLQDSLLITYINSIWYRTLLLMDFVSQKQLNSCSVLMETFCIQDHRVALYRTLEMQIFSVCFRSGCAPLEAVYNALAMAFWLLGYLFSNLLKRCHDQKVNESGKWCSQRSTDKFPVKRSEHALNSQDLPKGCELSGAWGEKQRTLPPPSLLSWFPLQSLPGLAPRTGSPGLPKDRTLQERGLSLGVPREGI